MRRGMLLVTLVALLAPAGSASAATFEVSYFRWNAQLT